MPGEAEAGPLALQALVAREVARRTPVLRSAVEANPSIVSGTGPPRAAVPVP